MTMRIISRGIALRATSGISHADCVGAAGFIGGLRRRDLEDRFLLTRVVLFLLLRSETTRPPDLAKRSGHSCSAFHCGRRAARRSQSF